MNKRMLLIFFALICMMLITPAEAKTWYVDDDGGVDFTDIQAAINSASSGDTIFVYSGTYSGFYVNIPYLSIIGEGTDFVTVGSSIYLPEGSSASENATGTVLEGIKLKSEPKITISSVSTASDLTFKNCTFTKIKTSNGVELDTDNVIFENNLVLESGGLYGIRVLSDNANFVNNTLYDSQSTYGAIAVWGVMDGLFENNTIVNSTGAAGLIYMANNCTFSKNNFLQNPEGILLYEPGNDHTFYNNNFIKTSLVRAWGWSGDFTASLNSTIPIKYTYNGQTYSGYMGNYYSDYTGTDENNDGIGDTPYTIPNDLGTDYYPLMQPYEYYFDEEPVLTSIDVTPVTADLTTNSTLQFTAVAKDQYGNSMPNIAFTWESSNEMVGTVNSTGYFTPLAVGSTTITASAESLNGTAQVTVETPELTTIEVSPSSAVLSTGNTLQFTARALDQDGNTISGIDFSWSSDNETVGTTDSTGLFSAIYLGTANLSAANGEVSGVALVTVTSTDLIADSIVADSPVQGKPGSVNVTVRNAGPVATGTFDVSLLADNTEVGRNTVHSLETGESCIVNISWTPSSYGEVNLTAFVDPEGAIADSGSANNILSETVTVTAFSPDLVAEAIAADSPVEGTAGDVNVTVRNTGLAAAGEFNVSLLADNVEVGRSTIPSLESGESRTVDISWTPSSYGEVNLIAVVDPEEAIEDSDISNNEISKTVMVTSSTPDLSLSSVSFTNYPFCNNTLKVTVLNSGAGNTGTFNVTVLIGEVSTNVTIPELGGGNSTTISIEDIIRQVGDTVAITVTADPADVIAETNETNNEYTETATISTTGQKYNGGRYSNGYDLVNNVFYTEGNVGVAVAISGRYVSTNKKVVTTRTFSAADLDIPAGATIKSARLYQGSTWYGDPGFNLQFNGHETQEADAKYWDCINGQYAFDVTTYLNTTGDNTAVLTSTNSLNDYAYYATALIVVYEADSEPYRQIWVNEGSDCLLADYGPELAWGYTMFDNVSTDDLFSARVITVLESDDGDVNSINFNGESLPRIKTGGSDPTIKYFSVTDALSNGENELGVTGPSYFNFANAVLEVTRETASEANFTASVTSGNAPLNVEFTDTSTGTPTSWAWDFGDGKNSTEQNPTHTYTAEGTYTVKLTISNSLGSDSEEKTGYITVGSVVLAPEANFSADPTTGTAPLSVQFTDESTNTPTSWTWDFGEGDTSNEQNPTHTYETIGTYTVKLIATNYGGSNFTIKTDYITVTSDVSAPIASFTMDSNSGRVPFTVQFTDTSNGSVSSWKWEFGDGGISTEQNPIHTYVTEGSYNVTLIATGPGGSNTITSTEPVVVSAPLTSDSYNGGIPLTNVQNGTVSGGLWYDSYYAMETSAQKAFTLPSYSDIKWARLYIDVYDGHMQNNYRGNVEIGIDADGDSTYELRKNETFNTTYSFPGEGGAGPVWLSDHMNRVTSDYLMWYDLTDAIGGQQVNVQAITSKIDSNFDGRVKAMTLVVAYDDGDSDEVYYRVNQGHDTVNPLDTEYTGSTAFDTSTLASGWDSASLSAIYLASVDGIYAFQSTTLISGTPQGSYYGDNTWDVSSMLTAGEDSTFTYNKQDEKYYKIPLVLMSVKYAGSGPVAPTADFSVNVTEGGVPLAVRFSDESTGSPTAWVWDFGDNETSSEQNPVHTYSAAGNYTVNLTVTNEVGSDSEVKTDYIMLSESSTPEEPVAAFTANVTNGDVPLTVQFSDESTGSPTSWFWDFGDGANSTEQSPIHTYTSAETYTVNLTVENAAGSDFESKSDYIEVSEASGSTVTLYFDPESSSVAENESTEINLVASNFPAGLSGYNLTVALDDPDVAEIVDIDYPSWALITENSTLPGTSIYMKTVDLEDAVKADAADVVLATLTISGREKGSANLSIGVKRLEEDSGDSIEPGFLTGTIEVTILSPLPDQEYAPKDLNGDGLYEDLTGNGEFSFVDIVAYFHNMDWIEENMPVEYFDFNGNGRIDFDDVVRMFAMI
ncbi:cell surface protein [Methanosarcina siciliae HI350]|uniref:Probable pectate lyase C n=1 Tax=Methanosarcina siciliae HI350 TaxID=1434119 RepID=A0A0E3PEK7_9EURY|nr:DUF3344 domain-containing protein [Methanosarcina siciliae]AKB32995.1 cell surface protein [Methanosarcina siciliae HI350]